MLSLFAALTMHSFDMILQEFELKIASVTLEVEELKVHAVSSPVLVA